MYPDVSVHFETSQQAAARSCGLLESPPVEFNLSLSNSSLIVEKLSGSMFSPFPFLALRLSDGTYRTDNFDEIEPNRVWRYPLGEDTICTSQLDSIGVGCSSISGQSSVAHLLND